MTDCSRIMLSFKKKNKKVIKIYKSGKGISHSIILIGRTKHSEHALKLEPLTLMSN
jgi:hypothetical protein